MLTVLAPGGYNSRKMAKQKTATKGNNPEKPTLNPRQALFVQYYTDPDSGTFGNGTQSALKARYTENGSHEVAAAQASVLLRNTKVINEVSAQLERLKAGDKVRLEVLGQILKGERRTKTKTTTSTLSESGGMTVTESETEHETSNADIIRANDLLNRMNGHYDKTRAVGDAMSAELKDLLKDQRARLREV